jgi:Secretion system C-terminal sorting domain/Leucine Rich Repeat
MPNLQVLDLYNNRLTGKLPYFNHTNLSQLRVESNLLIDTIPNFNLPNLEVLSVSYNQFTGQIPNFNLQKLLYLNVEMNQLSGSIPNASLPKLVHFFASSNEFRGNIPPFTYDSLKVLQLHNNQLQGCIPVIIKTRCTKLGAAGGSISGNPNLATQSWANYWNLNEGVCTTSTDDLSTIHIEIMPNPTNNWFTIRYDEMPKEILVYNSLGRLLQNIVPALEQVQIDMSAYATGIYFVKVQNTMHKIVKN